MANTLGSTISYYREKLGLSQEQLAAKSEISRGRLSLIEMDKATPRLSTLLRIASALDVPEENLTKYIEGDVVRPSPPQSGATTIAEAENILLRQINADLRSDKEEQRRRIAYLEEELRKSGGNLEQPGPEANPKRPTSPPQLRPKNGPKSVASVPC